MHFGTSERRLFVSMPAGYLIFNHYRDFKRVTSYTLTTEARVVTTYVGTTDC